MSFRFSGQVPASKSDLIRALLLQNYAPSLRFRGDSQCEDVLAMRGALQSLSVSSPEVPIFCGESGLAFRLLATRLTREQGGARFLTGHSRLLARPHDALWKLLRILGAEIRTEKEGVWITPPTGGKWKATELEVDTDISSQFASSLILNAWNLERPLTLKWKGARRSEGYLRLSLSWVSRLGLKWEETRDALHLAASQSPSPPFGELWEIEADASTAFTLASWAVASPGGEARFDRFGIGSGMGAGRQPDSIFPEILAQLGASGVRAGSDWVFSHVPRLQGVEVNVGGCPDLFPVLSVLCALAEGSSVLFGAPHLIHKESNRIARVVELVRAIGRDCEAREDGIRIEARRPGRFLAPSDFQREIVFDPEQDHRLVMAAGVARFAGYPVRILRPEVLKKSAPELLPFLQEIGKGGER